MMKTLCVAIVVLSLSSVGQSASLACEKLLKPVETSPDLSGRWYVIAFSSDSCLASAFINSMLWPSMVMDITAEPTPNVYNATFTANMHGLCKAGSKVFFHANNNLYEVDSNNNPTGHPALLLQTSCPDCLSGKSHDAFSALFSRRKTVTNAELKEFESQAECLGLYRPQVLNTVHEYVNCTEDFISSEDKSEIAMTMFGRLRLAYSEAFQCVSQNILYYPKAVYGWFTERWGNIW